MKTKLYRELAERVDQLKRCVETSNSLWRDNTQDKIDELMAFMPRGSGIDSGTKLLQEECKTDKLVFQVDFHHMDEHGFYDGWTEHKLTITPSFSGFHMHLSGRDRNQIKEYLYDTYHHALSAEIEWDGEKYIHFELEAARAAHKKSLEATNEPT